MERVREATTQRRRCPGQLAASAWLSASPSGSISNTCRLTEVSLLPHLRAPKRYCQLRGKKILKKINSRPKVGVGTAIALCREMRYFLSSSLNASGEAVAKTWNLSCTAGGARELAAQSGKQYSA